MAVVTLSIFEGRGEETKARLIKALTDAVVDELPAKPEHVRVIIYDVPVANYGVAGKTIDFKPENE
ncbi:MAG TPA: tautomerase family protein [Woeseiaceae bacterium]|nr:tautomerase family protein [Woeseiaceae bacterium]